MRVKIKQRGKIGGDIEICAKVWIGPYNLQFPTFQFLWFFENLIFVQYFIFLIFLVHSLKDNRDSHRILIEGGKSFGWHVFLPRERSNLVSMSSIWCERCSPRCSFSFPSPKMIDLISISILKLSWFWVFELILGLFKVINGLINNFFLAKQ